MQPDDHLDLEQPRTIPGIIFTTLGLYVRYAWLLLPLAAVAVIPYEVLVVLVAKTAELGETTRGNGDKLLILLGLQLLIVQPLLASLQVHALAMVGAGERPGYRAVVARTLPVLLNVIAAEIIAGILVALGFFLFVIPGLFLYVRLAIVAQAAAIEGLQWPGALRRSMDLTLHNWWRIFVVLLIGGIVNATVQSVGSAIANPGVNAGAVIVGVICTLLTLSFSALLSAVLYFDLRARFHYR